LRRDLVVLVAVLAILAFLLVARAPDTVDPDSETTGESIDEQRLASEDEIPGIAAAANVENPERERATMVPEANTTDDSPPAWPEDPKVMEAFVLAELQRLMASPTSIAPIECTQTECRIRFSSQTECGYGPFLEASRNPPINAVGIQWSSRVAGSGRECSVDLRTYPYRPEFVPGPGQFNVSGERLREEAAASLAPDDYDAEPQMLRVAFIGEYAAPVVVENTCAYDCATDGRQVIYMIVPEDVTCDDLRGVEQQFMARTSAGGLEERTFCVPNTLVSD
jgi:hypothetical protein